MMSEPEKMSSCKRVMTLAIRENVSQGRTCMPVGDSFHDVRNNPRVRVGERLDCGKFRSGLRQRTPATEKWRKEIINQYTLSVWSPECPNAKKNVDNFLKEISRRVVGIFRRNFAVVDFDVTKDFFSDCSASSLVSPSHTIVIRKFQDDLSVTSKNCLGLEILRREYLVVLKLSTSISVERSLSIWKPAPLHHRDTFLLVM